MKNFEANINHSMHIFHWLVSRNIQRSHLEVVHGESLSVDSHIERDVTPSILGKGMNLETFPIIAEHLPREDIIQGPPEDQSFIGTYSENVVETQSPRISLNLSCEFENQIFEPELEGFIFCLSPYFLCLKENDYQTMKDLHQCESHKYVDSIESWFRAAINPSYFYIIQKLLLPCQLKRLVSHALLCIEVYSLKLSVSIISTLLRTWLHWKYTYT